MDAFACAHSLAPIIWGRKTVESIPLFREVTLTPAISCVAEEGVSVERHLRRAGLSTPSPETIETLVPLHQVCDFLSSVARAEGICDLGLRIAGQQGIDHLGV